MTLIMGELQVGDFPTCAVCDHRVGGMVVFRDSGKKVVVFVAHCHGDVETTELPYEMMNNLGQDCSVSAGVAFQRKKIGGTLDVMA